MQQDSAGSISPKAISLTCMTAARAAFGEDAETVTLDGEPLILERVAQANYLAPILVFHANCASISAFNTRVWDLQVLCDPEAPGGARLAPLPGAAEGPATPEAWRLMFTSDAWLRVALTPDVGASPDVSDAVAVWRSVMEDLPPGARLVEEMVVQMMVADTISNLQVGNGAADLALELER